MSSNCLETDEMLQFQEDRSFVTYLPVKVETSKAKTCMTKRSSSLYHSHPEWNPPKVKFQARPVPKVENIWSKAPVRSKTLHHTEFKPFSFYVSYHEIEKRRKERLDKVIAEEQRKRQIRARPVPTWLYRRDAVSTPELQALQRHIRRSRKLEELPPLVLNRHDPGDRTLSAPRQNTAHGEESGSAVAAERPLKNGEIVKKQNMDIVGEKSTKTVDRIKKQHKASPSICSNGSILTRKYEQHSARAPVPPKEKVPVKKVERTVVEAFEHPKKDECLVGKTVKSVKEKTVKCTRFPKEKTVNFSRYSNEKTVKCPKEKIVKCVTKTKAICGRKSTMKEVDRDQAERAVKPPVKVPVEQSVKQNISRPGAPKRTKEENMKPMFPVLDEPEVPLAPISSCEQFPLKLNNDELIDLSFPIRRQVEKRSLDYNQLLAKFCSHDFSRKLAQDVAPNVNVVAEQDVAANVTPEQVVGYNVNVKLAQNVTPDVPQMFKGTILYIDKGKDFY